MGRAVYNQSMISKEDRDAFKLGIMCLQLWVICVNSVQLWTAERLRHHAVTIGVKTMVMPRVNDEG